MGFLKTLLRKGFGIPLVFAALIGAAALMNAAQAVQWDHLYDYQVSSKDKLLSCELTLKPESPDKAIIEWTVKTAPGVTLAKLRIGPLDPPLAADEYKARGRHETKVEGHTHIVLTAEDSNGNKVQCWVAYGLTPPPPFPKSGGGGTVVISSSSAPESSSSVWSSSEEQSSSSSSEQSSSQACEDDEDCNNSSSSQVSSSSSSKEESSSSSVWSSSEESSSSSQEYCPVGTTGVYPDCVEIPSSSSSSSSSSQVSSSSKEESSSSVSSSEEESSSSSSEDSSSSSSASSSSWDDCEDEDEDECETED